MNIRKESYFGILTLVGASSILFMPISRFQFQRVLFILFGFNLGWTLFSFFSGFTVVGIGSNISINATLLAIQFSIVLRNFDYKKYLPAYLIFGVLTFFALVCFKTSMGILAFFIGLWFLLLRWKKRTAIAAALVGMGVLILLDTFYFEHELFRLSSREIMWRHMLDFMNKQGLWLSGNGFGTFPFIGPMLQTAANWHPNGYYLHAHSDWLELIFELGIPGFILWVAAFTSLYYRAFKSGDSQLIYVFTCFGASMVGNMPLHLPLELAILFISIKVLSEGGDESSRVSAIHGSNGAPSVSNPVNH